MNVTASRDVPALRLVIGDKDKSSWSLRVWLILKRLGLEFEEVRIALNREDTQGKIAPYSPSGWIPVLFAGDLRLWDSLAIAEYLAEDRPDLWPRDKAARALARCVCAEMHSGFSSLRRQCPMDLHVRTGIALEEGAASDVARIVRLWREMRGRYDREGPFLFGSWSVADAFYAPVATRFRTYGIDLSLHGDDGIAREYAETLLAIPEMIQWEKDAVQEG